MEVLPVNDEEAFIEYAEEIVYQLQDFWHRKEGMGGYAVISLCAELENFIYADTAKEFNLPHNVPVWSRRDCIVRYQEVASELVRQFEFKVNVNWKKLYEDNVKNPRAVLSIVLYGGKSKKFKMAAFGSVAGPKANGTGPLKRGPKKRSAAIEQVANIIPPPGVVLDSPNRAVAGVGVGLAGVAGGGGGVGAGGEPDADFGDFGFDFDTEPLPEDPTSGPIGDEFAL
jgi:hypothetical protein